MLRKSDSLIGILLFASLLPLRTVGGSDAISFSRDILPILSDRCFHCHGPDPSHREADLRLDIEALVKGENGVSGVILPGDPEASELWYRIVTDDPDQLMPPPDSHRKPLSLVEREVIRRWIADGAPWGKHWAFEKPERSNPPGDDGAADDAKAHPVDAFVRARLAREGLFSAPPASPHVQKRRLSFALTGLPPAATMKTDDAEWGTLVDRLLESPHHAERLAMWWLDAARYSDTDGYQGDRERTNWPWRDWVINAFAQNEPFDQFTIEQFAGDLLPNATPEQILATCFHRNHMTNGEGGRDPEESRIDYVIDRVNTTGTVWLGLTLGCTQCHDHKFDPVSQEDYYSLFAFFNSIDEDGKAGRGAKPYLDYPSPHAERAVRETEAHVASRRAVEARDRRLAESRFDRWLEKTIAELSPEYRAWHLVRPTAVDSAEGTRLQIEDEATIQAKGPSPRQDDYRIAISVPADGNRISGWKLEVLPHESHTDGKLSRGKTGEFILTNVKLLLRREGQSQVREIAMSGAVADFEKEAKGRSYGKVRDTLDDDPRNGWTTDTGDSTKPHTAVFELDEPLLLSPDEELVFVLFQRSTRGEANIGRFRLLISGEAGETVRGLESSPLEDLAAALPVTTDKLDSKLRKRLLKQFLLDDAPYQESKIALDRANRQLNETRKAAQKQGVMVLAEREDPRETHILERGVWDAKGAAVEPGVLPAVLKWPTEETRSRLDFAKWLVASENPLTARVVVNHLWQLVFRDGLVRTPEDFGLQGEAPTHPGLLDWLAVELVENQWDLRHILRILVTSETFRQSSDTTPELQELDPENRLLARASRFRLPSWMIRDNALAASGLLNPAVGGPPVKPWQPEGVWKEIFMGGKTYVPSVGPAQYRRTVYAYWRRSSAPTFLFDNAQRRVCEVGTRRTNTPLHALTLMNDQTMLEASRALADIVREDPSPLQKLAFRVLSRELDSRERAVVERERERALAHYRSHPEDAAAFTAVGQQKPPPKAAAPEIAAWMTIASLMLNLDEAMTYE